MIFFDFFSGSSVFDFVLIIRLFFVFSFFMGDFLGEVFCDMVCFVIGVDFLVEVLVEIVVLVLSLFFCGVIFFLIFLFFFLVWFCLFFFDSCCWDDFLGEVFSLDILRDFFIGVFWEIEIFCLFWEFIFFCFVFWKIEVDIGVFIVVLSNGLELGLFLEVWNVRDLTCYWIRLGVGDRFKSRDFLDFGEEI